MNHDRPVSVGKGSLRCRRFRAYGDSGFAAPEAMFLIFVIFLVIIFVSLIPLMPERQHAARAAAAEGARAAILVDDPADGPAVAEAMVGQVVANYGFEATEFSVSTSGSIERGQPFTVTVQAQIPAIDFPGGRQFGPALWSTSATERVEDYRSFDP